MLPSLRVALISGVVLSVGLFLQLEGPDRFIGEPHTQLLAGTGLCLFGIVACWRRDQRNTDSID